MCDRKGLISLRWAFKKHNRTISLSLSPQLRVSVCQRKSGQTCLCIYNLRHKHALNREEERERFRERMGRSACCSKVGLRRGPWSAKEDSILSSFIQQHGEGQWRSLPKKAGLLRCGKSCRLRWMNYLRPGIKRGNIGEDEEDLIVRLHALLGNRWSLIAGRLPGRTDNEIKNYWNTHLHKKLTNHKPPAAAAAKKRKSRKPVKKEAEQRNNDSSDNGGGEGEMETEEIKATKVYLPKPIRISSIYSSDSGSSSSEGAAVEVAPPAPVLEAEDPALLYHYSGSVSGEFDMWEKVYAEYMQLL